MPQGAPRMCDGVYYGVFSKYFSINFSNTFFVVVDRGKVLTPKIDRKIYRYRVLRTEIGFLCVCIYLLLTETINGSQLKLGPEVLFSFIHVFSHTHTLKMESLGNYLTFINRP